MRKSDDTIDDGLRMLEQRSRLLLEAAVDRQLELAEAPWNEALKALEDYPKVEKILIDLSSKVLPYYIQGYEISPIHHIAYVVKFMALITTSEEAENRLSRQDVKCGVLAALLHDIGIGKCVLGKITEKMIENAPPQSQDRLRNDGIAARKEHMEEGAKISCKLLRDYQNNHPDAISDNDVKVILDIVQTHDNSKIPLMMKGRPDKKWLLSPDGGGDWLKQCHWEADALWMLTPAGILVDLQRGNIEDTPENRKERLEFNFALHQKIVELYAEAYGDELFEFKFRGGTLYRTEIGDKLALQLRLQAGLE